MKFELFENIPRPSDSEDVRRLWARVDRIEAVWYSYEAHPANEKFHVQIRVDGKTFLVAAFADEDGARREAESIVDAVRYLLQ